MRDKVQVAGVEDTRRRLPGILDAAHRDGIVTIVTKRGVPYAAVTPVSQALRDTPKFSALGGSGKGRYGCAGEFVGRLRDEWP